MYGFFDVLLTVIQVLALGGPNTSPEAKRSARSAAEERFHAYKTLTGNGLVALDGAHCDVLDSSESFSTQNGKIRDYVLTLFVVTPENRYFLFKSNADGKPYVQQLSTERAKLVLKGKFREYAGAA